MKYIYSATESFNCNINIDDLLNSVELNKHNYNHIPNAETFFENWKRALYNCYQFEINQVHHMKNEEYFWESIFIGREEVRLHFNITKASRLSLLQQPEKIPLDLFTENYKSNTDAVIKYSCPPMDEYDVQNYLACEIPIILVNYFHGGLWYLVIDGNHRVASRKKLNISYISGVLLLPQYVEHILSSNFEKAVYLFLYEGFLLEQDNIAIIENSNSKRFFNI